MFNGCLEDFFGGHHHAKVNHFVVITLQHDTDDIFTDVVYITLDGSHDNFAFGLGVFALFRFDIGNQVGHGLFHNASRLDHLGQKHFASAKQVAHHVHAVHQRAFDHLDGAGCLGTCFFRILFDVGGDAFDQCVLNPLVNRPVAPLQILLLGGTAAIAFILVGNIEKAFGAIAAAIEHDVFDGFSQLGGQVVIDCELPRVDDAHGEACTNGVVEKDRVNRLPHGVVASKRERHVGHAARDHSVGQVLTNPLGGFDKIDGVVVVLFDTRGDGENIRVEDDVFRREANFVH